MSDSWTAIEGAPTDIAALHGAWIGAAGGLYRAPATPGGGFERVLAAPITAIAERDGRLAAAGHGRLWCSDDGGESFWSPPALPVPDGASEPITATSTALAIGDGGVLWSAVCHAWLSFYAVDTGGPPIHHGAGASHCALYRLDGETWTRRHRHRVHDLVVDGDRVVIASDIGLIDGDRVRFDKPVTCVAIEGGEGSGSGRLVAGTRSSALVERDGRMLAAGTSYRDETGVTNEARHVCAVVTAPSGRVFAAARGLGTAGVFELDDNRKKLRWLGRNRGLYRSGVEVVALSVDASGAGWAATARHGLFYRPGLDARGKEAP